METIKIDELSDTHEVSEETASHVRGGLQLRTSDPGSVATSEKASPKLLETHFKCNI